MAGNLQKELAAEHQRFSDIVKSKEYSKVGETVTENATVMYNNMDPIVGRKAIIEFCKVLLPSFAEMIFEKNVYLEQTDDTTAMSTDFFIAKDDKGNTKELIQSTLLWRKVNGRWLIDREITSNRPMPQSIVKKQIEERQKFLFTAFNEEDCDKALSVYAKDAAIIPHEGEIVTGKEAIKALFKKDMPAMKTLVIEDTYYFELLNETTAYSNAHLLLLGSDGKTKDVLRDCLIWKKIDGEWFILRDMFNHRPLPNQ